MAEHLKDDIRESPAPPRADAPPPPDSVATVSEAPSPPPDAAASSGEAPATTPTGNRTADLPPAAAPKTPTPQPANEKMEVHHHPDLHHKRKHWREYFLEFLMIFLAVTMGFFAESFREHLADGSKEDEYIHSVVEDLKSDTLQANVVLKALARTTHGLDSLLQELSSDQVYTNSNDAYRLWSKYMGFADFVSNDRTIQQMKSSGELRLIRNKSVSDEIMTYDGILKKYYAQDELMNRGLTDQTIFSRLFDFIAIKNGKGAPVPLTAQGRLALNEAYANRSVWKFGMMNTLMDVKTALGEAKKLLALIKEQYEIN